MNESRITMTVKEAFEFMTEGQRIHMYNLLVKEGYSTKGVNTKAARGATLPGSRKPHSSDYSDMKKSIA